MIFMEGGNIIARSHGIIIRIIASIALNVPNLIKKRWRRMKMLIELNKVDIFLNFDKFLLIPHKFYRDFRNESVGLQMYSNSLRYIILSWLGVEIEINWRYK